MKTTKKTKSSFLNSLCLFFFFCFPTKQEWSVDDQKKPITKDAPQSATEIPQTPSQQKQDLDAGETDFNDNEQLWNWVLSLYKEAEEQPTITNKRTRSSISIDSQTDESNNDGTVNPKGKIF